MRFQLGKRYLVLLMALCLLSSTATAQFYGGGGGFGAYGGGGFGAYGGGGFGAGVGGQGLVLVKYGEKIYGALYKDLIRYNVHFIQVPADTIGVHYFDDGTHGDEVAYDGIPSNITINEDEYFGPFTIIYKQRIEKALEIAQEMGPHKFFSVFATSEQADSAVPTTDQYEQQFEDAFANAKSFLDTYESILAVNPEAERYVKSVDPALIESLEGAGALGGAGAGLGGGTVILPDLPPPPGLPEPNVRQGLQLEQDSNLETTETQQTGSGGPAGSFALDRANATVDGLNALNQ